jgi:hypothetical protein
MFAHVIARINPTIVRSTYRGLEYWRRKLPRPAAPGFSISAGSLARSPSVVAVAATH